MVPGVNLDKTYKTSLTFFLSYIINIFYKTYKTSLTYLIL